MDLKKGHTADFNSTPEEISRVSAFKEKFLQWLPTKQEIFLWMCHVTIILFILCILYSILEQEILPGSEIFALSLLYVLACIAGKIIGFVHLPPLLGMLIAGFLYRNFLFPHFYDDLSVRWMSTLRGAALVVILLKAGLGLDAEKLKKLKAVVLQLAFIPCIIETISVAVTSHFFIQLPWTWAMLLGFVLAAVSPAVVVPSLLNLQEKHYGTKKGIPTLVIAAASVDDIIAITGFTIMLSITLSEGSWIWSLAKGFLEPLAGFIFGVTCGGILWYIPSDNIAKFSLCCYRASLLCCGGLAVMFMSKKLDVAGAGPFGCLVLGFVASTRWKLDLESFPTIEGSISFLWKALQPFLFGLIGCEVTVSGLEKSIESSLAVLSISLSLRIVIALLVTFGGGFNLRERVFIAFAWLPKATVQAAVGPQALDYVLTNNKGPEMEDYAKKVLAIAVLSILLTAPIGAIFIALLGPVLLTNDEKDTTDQRDIHEQTDMLGKNASENHEDIQDETEL